ncbi:Cdc6-related protein, AAA superfamily ATPase [Halopelagius inordinatus]|uniref:Cdc6-related protein, AAA superfamily ATPase n=1 Tax=Halopelagius inordinatus TaxID=553467 RepID=A0A1I2PWL0_9EURY|nr:AAA family ATPase [Halopelagius inordinatus]SFG17986.1 Cdc6-related protein, AAA superfamily ATPase [Halopelagius inordinatus]
MRLGERIERRRRRETDANRLVRDLSALDPTVHPDEPTGRGPTLERLLDRLDPVFTGELPADTYVYGPKGAGKSAVVSAVFDHFAASTPPRRAVIHTTTRATSPPAVEFVYVDARSAASEFALLRAVLDAVVDDPVPSGGVGTAALRARLEAELGDDRRVVVAVDHVGEPETLPVGRLADVFSPVSESLSYVAVGRADPAGDAALATVEVPRYERHALADILTSRTSDGLARHALGHDAVSEVAAWADGDAHDGLAALFAAAVAASDAGAEGRIEPRHVESGMESVPANCCSLGRVRSLSSSHRRVLFELVESDDADRESVTCAAATIADAPAVDLSAATVKRLLYELAELDVVRRVAGSEAGDTGPGRPPSRPEPNVPTGVLERLDDRTVERRDRDRSAA